MRQERLFALGEGGATLLQGGAPGLRPGQLVPGLAGGEGRLLLAGSLSGGGGAEGVAPLGAGAPFRFQRGHALRPFRLLLAQGGDGLPGLLGPGEEGPQVGLRRVCGGDGGGATLAGLVEPPLGQTEGGAGGPFIFTQTGQAGLPALGGRGEVLHVAGGLGVALLRLAVLRLQRGQALRQAGPLGAGAGGELAPPAHVPLQAGELLGEGPALPLFPGHLLGQGAALSLQAALRFGQGAQALSGLGQGGLERRSRREGGFQEPRGIAPLGARAAGGWPAPGAPRR